MSELSLNDKVYKNIAEIKSVDHDTVISALEIVANFIKSRKYILYGGMSIDFALKHRGHKGIYDATILPDYDFMCSDYYNVSNELAKLLHAKGFTDVTAINALHLTSRRVRINTVPIADITYIPQEMLDTIPYIENTDGFRFVHPDFQRIDMLRSFNTMLWHPPMETIEHRTEKDVKRFRLLSDAYPITAAPVPTPAVKSVPKIGKILPDTELVLGGELAYLYYYVYMRDSLEYVKKDAVTTILLEKFNTIPKIKGNPGKTMPVNRFTYYTLDPATVYATLKKAKHKLHGFNRYLDDLAFRYIYSDTISAEFYDAWGTGVPYFNLKQLAVDHKLPDLDYPEKIAQIPMLMQYFLIKSFVVKDQSDYYRILYTSCEKLLHIGETLFNVTEAVKEKTEQEWPFLFSLNVFGLDTLTSNERRFSVSGFRSKLTGKPFKLQRAPFTFEVIDQDSTAQEYVIEPDNPIYSIGGNETDIEYFSKNKADDNCVF